MAKAVSAILAMAALGLAQCAVRAPQDIGAIYDPPMVCDACEQWNLPQTPFKVFGNVYYVGTKGLSSILITGKAGHVLIDGALTQSAPLIVQNIETLGFSIKDVRFILNSHAHYDHTGGLAALQRLSGAVVMASAPSAKAFLRGNVMEDDPQFGFGPKGNAFPAMKDVRVIADQQVVHLGDIALTAQFTPGHTPGGTSWTWQSCEGKTCLNFVFADSLSPFSPPEYRFSDQGGLQAALAHSIARIAQLPCDIMMTTHPMFFNMAEKAALAHKNPTKNPFIDPDACATYAAKNKNKLARKLAKENQP